jgi:hypothetical protein
MTSTAGRSRRHGQSSVGRLCIVPGCRRVVSAPSRACRDHASPTNTAAWGASPAVSSLSTSPSTGSCATGGCGRRMKVEPWQRQLVEGVFSEPRPRAALWSLPRGNGKTTLAAVLGLYGLYVDGEEPGANVVVVARDERQARLTFHAATRMVELHPGLTERTQLFQDRLVVPGSGSTFQVLPAEPRSLEGLDPSLAIVDGIGVVDRRVYEAVIGAVGKRRQSLTLMIGTPSPDGQDSVMWELVQHGREHDDTLFHLAEYHAKSLDHPIDCEHCWQEANPALDTFLARDGVHASLHRNCARRRSAGTGWASGSTTLMNPGCLLGPSTRAPAGASRTGWASCLASTAPTRRMRPPLSAAPSSQSRTCSWWAAGNPTRARRGSCVRRMTGCRSTRWRTRSGRRAATTGSSKWSATRTGGSAAWRSSPPTAYR